MTTFTRPLNRQEALFYFWIAALLWLGLVLATLIFWAVASVSTSRLTPVGLVADFPPTAQPYYVPIEREGKPMEAVWVVNTGAQIIALNSQHTNRVGMFNCTERVVWVPTNKRFEGPCTGDKFTLDGKWIPSFGNAHSGLQSFQLEVRGSELWIDLSRPISGDSSLSVIFTLMP